MLIVNADDFGRNRLATDRILSCHASGTVTSTSAMVYMVDSERAAETSRGRSLGIGLHLNLTESLNGPGVSAELRERHDRISRYMARSRLAHLVFHPGLRSSFEYVVGAQVSEFQRLYRRPPTHFDGHHHMHLSANVLLQGLIPRCAAVRRPFSFAPGEKSLPNRAFRALLHRLQRLRHTSPDFLFALPDVMKHQQLPWILELSRSAMVELETHPETDYEYGLLTSSEQAESIRNARLGTFAELPGRKSSSPARI